MKRTRVLDELEEQVIVPVIRERDEGRARRAVASLRRAGFRVFEITLTVPGAVKIVEELAGDARLTVGVGTVFTARQATDAAAAGARFVVSPAAIAEVASAAHDGGAAAVLGALTPTEVEAASRMEADAVKIFPAGSVGGAAHVKALRAVFPDVSLVPTGGIDVEDVPAYLAAGAHSVGIGSSLTRGEDADAIEASGRRHLEAVRRYAAERGAT